MSCKTPHAVVKSEKWNRKQVKEQRRSRVRTHKPWRVLCFPAFLLWLSSITFKSVIWALQRNTFKERHFYSITFFLPQKSVLRRHWPLLWGGKAPRLPTSWHTHWLQAVPPSGRQPTLKPDTSNSWAFYTFHQLSGVFLLPAAKTLYVGDTENVREA